MDGEEEYEEEEEFVEPKYPYAGIKKSHMQR
jgi:hypothetical protein